MTKLLLNELFSIKLKERLNEVPNHQSLIFFSAFIKKGALEWLADEIRPKAEVTIVSRWHKADLISGASDLEIFDYCKAKKWDFKILKNLHSKLYLLNQKQMFIGSANLTSRGLNISSSGNIEIGTEIEATDKDLELIRNLLDEAISLDQNTYDSICLEINESDESIPDQIDTSSLTWSQKVKELLEGKIEKLWVDDLFVTPALKKIPEISDEDLFHDCSLLNLDKGEFESNKYEAEEISKIFEQSKMFKWFLKIMKENPKETKTFGFFSEQLHNSLLDEPPPYRSGVKEYLNFFESWLSIYSSSVIVKKFNRTSSYTLVEKGNVSVEYAFQTFIKTEKKPRVDHNKVRQSWIGNGRSYEEILSSEDPRNLYRLRDGGINTHLKYDLEKEFIKIANDSWLGGPDSYPFAKGLDKSCFSDHQTAIPQRLYGAFGLGRGLEETYPVVLRVGKDFDNEFEAALKARPGNRYELKWQTEFTEFLKKEFPEWVNLEAGDKSYQAYLYFQEYNQTSNIEGNIFFSVSVERVF